MKRPKQNSDSPSTPQPGPGPSASPQVNPTFSLSAFSTASSSSPAAVSYQPYVNLDDWWLSTVEGHEGKISVAGLYEKDQIAHEFIAAPIAKRHEPCTLETEDGILVFLYGFFNSEKTLKNGFTNEACEKFCFGFPYWWDEWNVLYPNIMSTQTGSQARSRTSNSCEDSTVPSASTLGSTNDESKVGIDSASHINKGCQKTTVTSMRRRALHDKEVLGEATDVPYSSEKGKQPVGPSRKQRSVFGKLHPATRSPNIRSQIPYDNQSPLTRGRANSLSVSTPESLKLKKTKSGRVVVPTLDSGCQNIVYTHDGSICAIVGLDSPPELNGSTPKVYATKKKRTR